MPCLRDASAFAAVRRIPAKTSVIPKTPQPQIWTPGRVASVPLGHGASLRGTGAPACASPNQAIASKFQRDWITRQTSR